MPSLETVCINNEAYCIYAGKPIVVCTERFYVYEKTDQSETETIYSSWKLKPETSSHDNIPYGIGAVIIRGTKIQNVNEKGSFISATGISGLIYLLTHRRHSLNENPQPKSGRYQDTTHKWGRQ